MIKRGVGRPRDPGLGARFMDVAAAHIVEYGLHALTVNAIVTDVHAGKASFYRRWPDMDHFLADVVRHLRADPVTAPRARTVLFASGRNVRALVEAGDS